MTDAAMASLARAYGFARAYRLDASLAAGAPKGIRSLVLLIFPYSSWGRAVPGCPWISAYYFAAQEAYQKAGELKRVLTDRGESAEQCNGVRIKPLLSLLSDFAQGRNTLHYHKDFGSRFHVQVIGLGTPPAQEERQGQENAPDMCGACRTCLFACPSQALTEVGFQRDRCLRQHMLRGSPVPEELRPLMESRLLGCDICQQVCPYNAALPEGENGGECFPIESLLEGDNAVLASLSDKIGRNMAFPNRICAQACLAAGNSKDPGYLPALKRLLEHPSHAVAEHASWAVKKLTNGADKTTS